MLINKTEDMGSAEVLHVKEPSAAYPAKDIALADVAGILMSLQEEVKELRARVERLEQDVGKGCET